MTQVIIIAKKMSHFSTDAVYEGYTTMKMLRRGRASR